MNYMREIKATTWANQIVGAYKYVLSLRTKSILKSSKNRVEKQNKKAAQGYKIFSFMSWVKTIVGYLFIIGILSFMLLPAFILNQVRQEIRAGNWESTSKGPSPTVVDIHPPPDVMPEDEDEFADDTPQGWRNDKMDEFDDGPKEMWNQTISNDTEPSPKRTRRTRVEKEQDEDDFADDTPPDWRNDQDPLKTQAEKEDL